MIDYRIQTFLAVCQTMNYTRAAQQLNLTQPAVSQHIAYLEKEYGAKLFTYANRRLSLTDAGRLLQGALRIRAHDDQLLRQRIAAASSGAGIALSVGMTLTAGEYVVAAPLADYVANRPNLRITAHSGGTRELLSLLDEGTIDCAFVEGFFDKRAYAWDVCSTQCLVAVCAPGHAFACAGGQPRTYHDLFGECLIVRESGSGTRAVLEHALAAQNLTINAFTRIATAESLNVIKRFVERDLGITFMYQAAVQRELDEGTLCKINLQEAPVRHDITFIRLPDSAFEAEFQMLFSELAGQVD